MYVTWNKDDFIGLLHFLVKTHEEQLQKPVHNRIYCSLYQSKISSVSHNVSFLKGNESSTKYQCSQGSIICSPVLGAK